MCRAGRSQVGTPHAKTHVDDWHPTHKECIDMTENTDRPTPPKQIPDDPNLADRRLSDK